MRMMVGLMAVVLLLVSSCAGPASNTAENPSLPSPPPLPGVDYASESAGAVGGASGISCDYAWLLPSGAVDPCAAAAKAFRSFYVVYSAMTESFEADVMVDAAPGQIPVYKTGYYTVKNAGATGYVWRPFELSSLPSSGLLPYEFDNVNGPYNWFNSKQGAAGTLIDSMLLSASNEGAIYENAPNYAALFFCGCIT